MFIDLDSVDIYVKPGTTDMRKQINGLSVLVRQELNLNPFSGALFVFCNRRRNIMKILYWDRNGFCLWHKRLEKDRFKWPDSSGDTLIIDERELAWLMEGLAIEQKGAHRRLSYSTVY